MRGPSLLGLPAACLVASGAAAAPLAVLSSNNGSLPPPYRVDVTLTLEADGTVTLATCKGYDETDCETRTGRTTEAALRAVEAAARGSGCVASPLRDEPSPPVGGGFVHGAVVVDGVACALPAFVLSADEPRKSAVIAAIRAAVPADMAPSDMDE